MLAKTIDLRGALAGVPQSVLSKGDATVTKSRTAGRPLVAYYRVSTQRQGVSGLSLEAQRAAVAAHVVQTGVELLSEYVEVEKGGGKKVYRPELLGALRDCRLRDAVLVIAKFDRLARNVAFLSTLMEDGVDFIALDLPEAKKFHLHIMAAVAEQEADTISERTKAALTAAKARGVILGRPENLPQDAWRSSIAVRRARAAQRQQWNMPLALAWYAAGMSLQQIADELTKRNAPLPRKGTRWHYVQVKRLLALARRQQAETPTAAAVPARRRGRPRKVA